MKRTLFFVGLLASVMLFGSCNKDDMELLRHPFRLEGDLSPSFCLPVVSSGQMNLNDLLTSFDGTFSGYITPDNTITFHYDTSFRETINIGGMVTKSKGNRPTRIVKASNRKYSAPFISRDTIVEYTIPIDIFDKADMQTVVDGNLAINELRVKLSAFIQGQCPPNVDSILRENVNARVDNLTIKYTGHNYQQHTFTGFADQTVYLQDVIEGGKLKFDSVNVADIINSMPRSITAGFRLHVEVDSAIVLDNLHNFLTDTSAITSFQTLLDSLKLTSLTYGADIDVKLPFEVRIGGLTYGYDLDLKGNGESSTANQSIFDALDSTLTKLLGEGAVSMDSSKVAAILKFNNGIPLDLTLNGTLVDANGGEYPLFTNKKIASAVTGPVEGRPGVKEAVRDSTSYIDLPLTVEDLDKLTQATKLRLSLVLATADFANDPSYRVIKRDDYLKVKMLIKLDPSIQIDMQLFEGLGGIIDRIPFINTLYGN